MADAIGGAWGWLTSLSHGFFYISRFCISTGFLLLILALTGAIFIPPVIAIRLIFFGFAVELWKYSDGWSDWIPRCSAIVLFGLSFTPFKYLLFIYRSLAS
jgi:hypothetical protein